MSTGDARPAEYVAWFCHRCAVGFRHDPCVVAYDCVYCGAPCERGPVRLNDGRGCPKCGIADMATQAHQAWCDGDLIDGTLRAPEGGDGG